MAGNHPDGVSGTRVVITGGTGDLGSAIATEFLGPTYQVFAPGRGELDVTCDVSIQRYFSGNHVDLLVCCAGILEDQLLIHANACDWDRMWGVHFLGAKSCARAAMEHMENARAGHVVFVSSHSALYPPVGQAMYAAAKRAILGLTRDLARRHGRQNIRVNAIVPGFLDNRMTKSVSDKRRESIRNDHALGRWNTMDRVAAFVRFLHEQMPHTSGQWFQLDSRDSLL